MTVQTPKTASSSTASVNSRRKWAASTDGALNNLKEEWLLYSIRPMIQIYSLSSESLDCQEIAYSHYQVTAAILKTHPRLSSSGIICGLKATSTTAINQSTAIGMVRFPNAWSLVKSNMY